MCLPLGTPRGDCGAWEVQDLMCAAHLTQLALIALSTPIALSTLADRSPLTSRARVAEVVQECRGGKARPAASRRAAK